VNSYQQLAPLRPEEREALKADIAKRGVLVPVEVDEDGNILDGFNRTEIAQELGIEAPRIVRSGWSEEEKVEHALKINLLRRHLGPVSWGEAFRKLAEVRGVRIGTQGRQVQKTDTVSVLAKELGVDERTAERRVKAARELEREPDLFEAADTGSMTVKEAVQEARKRERAQRPAKEPIPMSIPEIPVRLEVADALSLPLEAASVDLIITSPPYGLEKPYLGSADLAGGWREFMADWLCEARRVAKFGGRLALNVPLDTSSPHPRATYAAAVEMALFAGWKYRWTIVWNEGNVSRSTARGSVDSPSAPHVICGCEVIAVFSNGEWIRDSHPDRVDLTHEEWLAWTNGLWSFPGESRPWMGHPAPFPPELPRRLIKLLSYVGDTVLDPFVGSGTTVLEAHQLGREALGFDICPEYIDQSRRRIAEVLSGTVAHS
jgi:site-specific DNA-methyltransferase (adenine-specific)